MNTSPQSVKSTRSLGQLGEQIAVQVLRGKGYRIEACNWHAGALGEIDIVARLADGPELLVFVEVKTRRSTRYGSPCEAVTPRKQAKMRMLAEAWLAKHPQDANCQVRFDVVGIVFNHKGAPAQIEHLENAFD